MARFHSAMTRVRRASALGLLLCGSYLGASAATAADNAGAIRLLTPSQYAGVIADAFGPTIKLGGRLDAGLRVDGLLEIGAAQMSVSASEMDQYDVMARSIAAQVVNEQNRNLYFPCKPADVRKADAGCSRQFIEKVGAVLFRRPLTAAEIDQHIQMSGRALDLVHDFYGATATVLASMLESPEFLFRTDGIEPDPARPGEMRLSAYGKATRLSFFIWNRPPDDLLIAAAKDGSLDTPKGVEREIARMTRSPKMSDGLRAFFDDMLRLTSMDEVVKDADLYPKFNNQVASDAREQTLRTILDVVLAPKGDYRDIFTTRKTYLTPMLASVYGVPLAMNVPNGSADYWAEYEFLPDSPRAGILSHLSFLTLNSHPGRSSATLRGKAVREVLLCQKVPPPPGDVNFTIVQDTNNPQYKTARERLTAHRSNPVCAGCHKLVDPLGLALETFDGDGSFRAQENGATIDTVGELEGVKFANDVELGRVLHDHQATSSCLVDRMIAYGLGRKASQSELPWADRLKASFKADGYSVPTLVKHIATSPEFFRLNASASQASN